MQSIKRVLYSFIPIHFNPTFWGVLGHDCQKAKDFCAIWLDSVLADSELWLQPRTHSIMSPSHIQADSWKPDSALGVSVTEVCEWPKLFEACLSLMALVRPYL